MCAACCGDLSPPSERSRKETVHIKNLKFNYRLSAEYSDTVNHHSFSVMFLPGDTGRQKITNLNINIDGCEKYCVTRDSFKNKKFYGLIESPHRRFDVSVSGTAQTGLDIFEEFTLSPVDYAVFKVQTPLTLPGDALKEYRRSCEFESFDNDYEKALHLMHSLYCTFRYEKGATGIHENAEAALKKGCGVCQDYAHIMLSILRSEKIAARYTVGMIPGEGASHAWVEVLCNGYWYGFDPTNNKLVNDEYIRVSCGRDSNDCSVIRGSFYGIVSQKQSEYVAVEEI